MVNCKDIVKNDWVGRYPSSRVAVCEDVNSTLTWVAT